MYLLGSNDNIETNIEEAPDALIDLILDQISETSNSEILTDDSQDELESNSSVSTVSDQSTEDLQDELESDRNPALSTNDINEKQSDGS